MKLSFIYCLGVLLLIATVNCNPLDKLTNITNTIDITNYVNLEEKFYNCTNVTTQEKCLSSPCIWCETKCVEYKTLNLIIGKSDNCPSGEATFKHTWLKVWYFKLFFIGYFLLFLIILAVCAKFCCCSCSVLSCLCC